MLTRHVRPIFASAAMHIQHSPFSRLMYRVKIGFPPVYSDVKSTDHPRLKTRA